MHLNDPETCLQVYSIVATRHPLPNGGMGMPSVFGSSLLVLRMPAAAVGGEVGPT